MQIFNNGNDMYERIIYTIFLLLYLNFLFQLKTRDSNNFLYSIIWKLIDLNYEPCNQWLNNL